MTKYIEINGTRYDLTEEGHVPLGDGSYLVRRVVEGLGLEVKEDPVRWTIEQGNTTYRFRANCDVPLNIPDYATGLRELADFAAWYSYETFDLRKNGVTVATLKGEFA